MSALTEMTGALVERVQQQQAEIYRLQRELRKLAERVEALERRETSA